MPAPFCIAAEDVEEKLHNKVFERWRVCLTLRAWTVATEEREKPSIEVGKSKIFLLLMTLPWCMWDAARFFYDRRVTHEKISRWWIHDSTQVRNHWVLSETTTKTFMKSFEWPQYKITSAKGRIILVIDLDLVSDALVIDNLHSV